MKRNRVNIITKARLNDMLDRWNELCYNFDFTVNKNEGEPFTLKFHGEVIMQGTRKQIYTFLKTLYTVYPALKRMEEIEE